MFNEEQSLKTVVDKVVNIMNRSGLEYETIIVDDASTDGSLNTLEASSPDIVRHSARKGYGGALKTGIRHAQGDIVFILDADGTYPIERLPELIDNLVKGNHGMVVGSRTGQNVAIPLIRRPVKWLFLRLANYLTGVAIPDINSGFRVFRRDLALAYFNLLPNGFSFTSTITLAFLCNDISVNYVPIDYFPRLGKSKIHPLRDPFVFIQLIARTVMYFNPLKVFLPLSALLFSAGVFVLLYSYFFTPNVMDITTIVLFTSSCQVAVIGLLADLIVKRTSR